METSDHDVTNETYTITLEAGADGGIGEILEAIADVDGTDLAVRDVRVLDGETVTVDTDALTGVQRETLIRAVEAGYYATPRATSLDRLANEFDVSKSAISQRLRKAEATLARRVVSEIAPERSVGTDADVHR
ncbi:helix-turn-helix domain-containing protein [Halorubrum sp. DTA98]|uniref:helix-turn-helix domain-containing protein n=1 Tax=Halorubrum sp. DTA98 TaxID=3402163 RepID=UPI003AAA4AE5